MTALITLEQLMEFKSITANLNVAKSLLPYVYEAQEFDLRPFLGEQLYLDLLDSFDASPSLEEQHFADLYNGSVYTDTSGKRRSHQGIVAVLAYFTFARFIENANLHSTKYGFKVKENEFSSEPSEKAIARRIAQARSGAIAYQERVKRFLDDYAEDFGDSWQRGTKRRRGQLRITAVGGNSKDVKYNKCIRISTSVIDSGCDDDYVDSSYVE